MVHSGDSDSDQHAAAQSQKLKCPQPGCRKTFTRRYNLQSHLMVHSGLRPYSCEFCGAAFSRQHDLRRHVRSLHLEIRPHQCIYCPLSFARSDALKRHLISEGKRDPATHPAPTS
ncbi:hypothetical protein BJ742DRAFT_682076 [Cladochytrium replicatum]|nr:hypothetical protein BJ742DRAFT_682076 [Cladochytrium replicatum]